MRTIPPQIASLFERHAALCGFSVHGCDESEFFIGDIGICPPVGAEQCAEIFQELVVALAELIAEQPEAAESLRGRTFARVLH